MAYKFNLENDLDKTVEFEFKKREQFKPDILPTHKPSYLSQSHQENNLLDTYNSDTFKFQPKSEPEFEEPKVIGGWFDKRYNMEFVVVKDPIRGSYSCPLDKLPGNIKR